MQEEKKESDEVENRENKQHIGGELGRLELNGIGVNGGGKGGIKGEKFKSDPSSNKVEIAEEHYSDSGNSNSQSEEHSGIVSPNLPEGPDTPQIDLGLTKVNLIKAKSDKSKESKTEEKKIYQILKRKAEFEAGDSKNKSKIHENLAMGGGLKKHTSDPGSELIGSEINEIPNERGTPLMPRTNHFNKKKVGSSQFFNKFVYNSGGKNKNGVKSSEEENSESPERLK